MFFEYNIMYKQIVKINKNKILAAIIFMFLLTFNCHAKTTSTSTKLDTVSIQLRYFHQFQFAGYYMAQAKGFYEEEGLYLKTFEYVERGVLYKLLAQEVNFSISNYNIIQNILDGAPVVLLKAIYQYSPIAIITLKKNNIRTPSDLIGKRLMMESKKPNIVFSKMFEKENVPTDKILFIQHSFNYDDLISGKVDAATGHITVQPYYLKSKGYEPWSITPSDYGINFYDDFLITSTTELKKHPKRVEAFVRASIKGWQYAYEHIDETIDVILSLPSKRPFKLTHEMLLNEAESSRKCVLPEIVEIGQINQRRIEYMENIYKDFYGYKNNIDYEKSLYNYKPPNILKKYIWFIIAIIFFIILISYFIIYLLRIKLKKKSRALAKEIKAKTYTESILGKERRTKKAILYTSPDLMFIISKAGTILEVNIPIDNDLSIVEEEIINKNIIHIIPQPSLKNAIEDAFSTRKLQFCEFEISQNPIKKIVESRINFLTDDEVLVIIRDITEIREKENELKRSEEKFSKIFHNAPDPIFITDLETHTIMDCNQNFEQLVGFTRNNLIGKTLAELELWLNDKDRIRFFDEISQKGHIHESLFNFRKKDESIINCVVSVETVVINNRNAVFGTFRDITELTQKENMLKKAELNFSLVLEFIPIPITITSISTGKILNINSKGADFFGVKKEEILGKTFLELNLWKEKSEREKYIRKLLEEGSVKDFETTVQIKNGNIVPCSIYMEIIEINQEKSIIGCLVDLSTIKKKEFELQKVLNTVQELKQKLAKENILLKEEIDANYNIGNIITKSYLVKKELQKIQQVAPTNTTVLILGETGTGKELFARTIHRLSNRADKPLIKVNCAALPAGLIESELFGHEKGAFTGAIKQHIGRFELANNATIFLDEIGELPLEIQSKLLRVIQEGEFERVGSSTTISTNARIIAASNRDLQKMTETGTFREDLFYRLNVFPIRTIPLRERPEDIEPLVNNFIKQISPQLGKKITSIEKSGFNLLLKYPFPGNIRELQNIVERAIIESENSVLEITLPSQNSEDSLIKSAFLTKELILATLEECSWKIEGTNGAAKKLGIPPSTLRDKIKKYNLKKP